jgi:hypothetical protein
VKHFYFRIAADEAAAFASCLDAWRRAGGKPDRPAALVGGTEGGFLKLPARELDAFCAVANARLSLFTQRRLEQAARVYRQGKNGPR